MGRSIGFIVLASIVLSVALKGEGKKVLLLPLFTKSHVFSLTVIGEELVRRGHVAHMLVIENFPLSSDLTSNKSGISILRYRDQRGEATDYEALFANVARSIMDGKQYNFFENLSFFKGILKAESLNLLVGNDRIMEEMTEFKYDIAIVDSIFFAKYLHLIPVRLGIPWITYTDLLNPWLAKVPWLPSFHNIKTSPFFGKMTFLERLGNTVMSALFFCYPLVPDPPEEVLAVYQRYGTFSSLDDLIARSSLFITTSDVVLDDALPFQPNMIHAGGLTAKPANSKPLPQELQNFVTAAKSGIVIVSFGSMASTFPDVIAQKFISAFSNFPDLHFIWRFKNTDHLTIPKNVMIADWLPQNDLLAHPRTELFITHSGNNGQFEAVFHGVPMIGFPLLGDQEHNAKRLSSRGYGIAMNLFDFTSDNLVSNIREIITNRDYKKRVSLASEIFRSAPRSPAERVVDGIEHVMRFGSDHLHPAGNDLPLYQYLMLDILAFVALLLIGIALVVRKFVLFLFRRLTTNGSRKPKSE